jgi:hypothetical protein
MQGAAPITSLASLCGIADPAGLLSNGHYVVLLTGCGTGFARCDGIALTPWSADRIEGRQRDARRGARP